MSYLLIIDQIESLPRAIELNEETVELALQETSTIIARIRETSFAAPLFLVDQDNKSIHRIYLAPPNELKITSEDQAMLLLGANTGYEYFEGPLVTETANDC